MKRKEWVEAQEAAKILTKKSGRAIGLPYVRQLAFKGKIRFKAKDGRTNLYSRADLDAYPPVQTREGKRRAPEETKQPIA